MIAKLTGKLDSTGDGWAVVDVGGVGYLVHCATRTLAALPCAGQPVMLLIETVVREDAFLLYGFEDARSREWFRLLQTAQNVGARVALAVLSTLSPDELANAIAAGDRNALTRTPGVGPKVADRLITELKDKAAGMAGFALPGAPLGFAADAAQGPAGDAVSALVNLGYAQAEAFAAVARAAEKQGPGSKVEALIRIGLQELSQ